MSTKATPNDNLLPKGIINNIIEERITKAKRCRELTFNMVTLYHELRDSHGIADAGMELQAQDRVISALNEIKEELLKE
jgi:hypothetical protein